MQNKSNIEWDKHNIDSYWDVSIMARHGLFMYWCVGHLKEQGGASHLTIQMITDSRVYRAARAFARKAKNALREIEGRNGLSGMRCSPSVDHHATYSVHVCTF